MQTHHDRNAGIASLQQSHSRVASADGGFLHADVSPAHVRGNAVPERDRPEQDAAALTRDSNAHAHAVTRHVPAATFLPSPNPSRLRQHPRGHPSDQMAALLQMDRVERESKTFARSVLVHYDAARTQILAQYWQGV